MKTVLKRDKNLFAGVLISLVLLFPGLCMSAILKVPANYPTIQSAVYASADWDTILVSPGVYQGCFILEKNLTIGSLMLITGDTSYIDQTVVQGGGSVFTIHLDTYYEVELYGMTLRNGTGAYDPCIYGDSLFHGGAISIHIGILRLKNMVITNNSADRGGGIDAIFAEVITENVVIRDNVANISGGGIYMYNGYCTLHGTSLINNTSESGGGYLSEYSNTVMYNCYIANNNASVGGGTYSLFTYSFLMNGCHVSDNHAQTGIGGIGVTIWSFGFPDLGYAVNNQGTNRFRSTAKLINLTVTGNTAPVAGGLVNGMDAEIYNSIFWGNVPGQIHCGYPMSICYSDIEGGFSGIPNNNLITDYVNNLNVYPCFSNPSAGDFSLLKTSPCINKGAPDTTGLLLPAYDLAGNKRIIRDTVDIGAYEFRFPRYLQLKVFLEGPFNAITGAMNNHLGAKGYLPSGQPFNVPLPYFGNPAPAWFYEGDEQIDAFNNPDIVDWVLIGLNESAWNCDSAFFAPSVRQRQAGFVLVNGEVVSADGLHPMEFNDPQHDSVYVCVFHRNHVGVMSGSAVTVDEDCFTYDFTGSAGAAYHNDSPVLPFNVPGHKELAAGIYGCIAADGNADYTVAMPDKSLVWQTQAGTSGYKPADFNLDGCVNNSDKNDCWLKNFVPAAPLP